MEKTKKAKAIKKLQTELKIEKQAEIIRCELSVWVVQTFVIEDNACRRREITMERKKAAEERQRLEHAKAQVCSLSSAS
jgi:rRNA-processing protein CGR1